MTISRGLYLAIFSMDSYNRGYGFGIANLDESGALGSATIRAFGEDEQDSWVDSDFYAIAYNWRGETVIAYRGSDYFDTNSNINLWSRDIWQGWSSGAGFPFGGQPALALRFYEAG
jgi:hypothetical protein